jgi:hypothetical protein
LMRSSDLLQVVLSGLLQVDIWRLDATCFINLHQVCKCQLAASLISTGLLQVDDNLQLKSATCSKSVAFLAVYKQLRLLILCWRRCQSFKVNV